jgi:hypothetical protein
MHAVKCSSARLTPHSSPVPLQSQFTPPPPAVVLVLSKEFISKRYPMEELRLLLEWRRQGSPAVLLPVFHSVDCEEVGRRAAEYEAATSDPHKQQWAKDLKEVLGITGARADQVMLTLQIVQSML